MAKFCRERTLVLSSSVLSFDLSLSLRPLPPDSLSLASLSPSRMCSYSSFSFSLKFDFLVIFLIWVGVFDRLFLWGSSDLT